MYQRIVLGYDGSKTSERALHVALELAHSCEARLDVLIVEEIYPHSGTVYELRREKTLADRTAEQLRRRVADAAKKRDITYNIQVFTGPPVAFITEFVDEAKADLLVIGASEHVRMIELVIGRRSDRIAHQAKCSVLIAR